MKKRKAVVPKTIAMYRLPHKASLIAYTKKELLDIAEWCKNTFEAGTWAISGTYPGWLNFEHGTDMITFKLVWTK